MSLADQLQAGLAALGFGLTEAMQSRLLGYVGLLKKWNRTYNLTAIRGESEMVTQHLLDSLSVLKALPESALVERRWVDSAGRMSAAEPDCLEFRWQSRVRSSR